MYCCIQSVAPQTIQVLIQKLVQELIQELNQELIQELIQLWENIQVQM